MAKPVLDGGQALGFLQCGRLHFAMRSEWNNEPVSIWTAPLPTTQSTLHNQDAAMGVVADAVRGNLRTRPRSGKTPGTFPLCLSAPPCCGSQTRAPLTAAVPL